VDAIHVRYGNHPNRFAAMVPEAQSPPIRWFSGSRHCRTPVSSDLKMPSTGRSRSHRAFIALGSNLGDRIDAIEHACLEMEREGIKIKRTSSLFETAPMYVVDQEPFINGVCEVRPRSFAYYYFDLISRSISRSKPL
jgi:hypothetical protein